MPFALPYQPRLKFAAQKLLQLKDSLVVPAWGQQIIAAQLVILKYLISREERSCDGSDDDTSTDLT